MAKTKKATETKKVAKDSKATRPTTRARKKPVKKTIKRASSYDKKVAFAVLDLMESGMSLRQALSSDPSFPTRRTFYRWRQDNDELEAEYQLVCQVRDDDDFDKAQEIADNTTNETYQADRIKLDHLKWALGKRQPTRYGTQKIDMKAEHSGSVVVEVVDYADAVAAEDTDTV